jgi:phosphatidylserine decarboxylase
MVGGKTVVLPPFFFLELIFRNIAMLAYRYPLIAREGWLWIAVVAVAAAWVQINYGLVALPLWLLVLLLLFLFRDPARRVPASPLGIVSPVDGKVVAVDTVHDSYLDREALCISIKMRFTSVYSAHSPMEGKIMQQWLGVPRRIDASVQAGSEQAESRDVQSYAQWIQSDEADDVVMVMEASLPVSRPQCYAHSGERIGQGQRCGFIRFGSQVDVLLPANSRINVAVGDSVLAGTDIIATLVHTSTVAPETMANAGQEG